MGAPSEVIEQFNQDKVEDDLFEVFPENWEAVNLFLRLDTQWRRSLMPCGQGFISRAAGIDYTALESLMRMHRIEDMTDCFDRVRTMELAALEAMAET
jgi:hypothetical protein